MATEPNKQVGLVVWLTNTLHEFDWRIDNEGHIVINGDAQAVADIFTNKGLACHVVDGVIHFDSHKPVEPQPVQRDLFELLHEIDPY